MRNLGCFRDFYFVGVGGTKRQKQGQKQIPGGNDRKKDKSKSEKAAGARAKANAPELLGAGALG
jgi:hypothetical protein